jgi:site-specific recombinase XerD
MLLAVNGLRNSELVNIDKKDISHMDNYKVITILGKGSKTRISKLTGAVETAVSKWLEIHPGNSGPLFVAYNGREKTDRRICTETLRYLVKKYTRKAGIEKRVTPHALRHAAITYALANGANILKVKEMAGHSSLNTTQR